MARPTLDEYFLNLAVVVATRGTCFRRTVGCVLVGPTGRALATGYNGPPSGAPHCIDAPCAGARAPAGTGLDLCEAVHAEMNALLSCADVRQIHTCYVTHSPCVTCVKLLLNTSCRRVVFSTPYAHDAEAKRRWLEQNSADLNRTWEQV